MRTLALILVVCWSIGIFCAADCPPNNDPNYGNPIGAFMGIQAKSNGDYVESGCGVYQCVHLVKQFAAQYHEVIDYEVGSGANMWSLLPQESGYLPIANDSSIVQPQVGDFVVWWGGTYGHVAIVSRVMENEIEVFEQNILYPSPFRELPINKRPDGTWHMEPGPRLSNYTVQGWLRYPSFSVIGRYDDGQRFDQHIKDCYDRINGYQCSPDMGKIGWPIDDGGGVFVHNWEPWIYICQNFRNARGEESIIMYDPLLGSQAYLISGKYWEFYRYGRWDSTRGCQRYGPDMPMDDGTVLGCPTSDFINGQQCFQNGYCKSGSVELHRLDGTLVEVFEPTGEFSALTLTGKPMSENHNTIEWLGGPACDYYAVFANGTEIGQTTLLEFTEAGLPTGSTRQYQVVAMSNSTGALDASNVVTITGPGNPGSFTLQGAPDGYNSAFLQWQNTAYPYAPFLWLFRDGVRIAKLVSGFSQWGDYPLEPSHGYTYQLAAVTASELVLGWSNAVTITTDPAPPPPPPEDPVPTSVQIQIEPTWLYATDGWGIAKVFDQFGNEMTGVRVLFFSSNSSVFVISGDNGYCIANGIGRAEVWAEVYDRRWVQSERVSISVVSEIPPEPIEFESSPLRLDCDFELLSTPPFIEYRQIMVRVYLSNPTDQPVTFYGPRGFVFREDGSFYDCSSFSSTPNTLNPGESGFYLASSIALPEAGRCFVRIHTCPTKSMVNTDWQVIDQTAEGISSTLWLNVISEADLKAQLKFLSLEPIASEIYAGDPIAVRAGIINSGDINITTPFALTVSIAGQSSQTYEIEGLTQGGVYYHTFDLGQLPAGSYKVDGFIDPGNVVAEYNESDNTGSVIIQVKERPAADLNATIQVSPSELRVGGTVIVSGVASNIGLADAATCQLALTFGDQTAVIDLPAIAKGTGADFSQAFSLTQAGVVSATVTVDSTNVIIESNETNNGASVSVTVLEPLKPNVVITGASFQPDPIHAGQQLTILFTVANSGQAEMPAAKVGLVQGQNVCGTVDVPALTCGQSFGGQFSFATLASWQQMTYIVVADFTGVAQEENEQDNAESVTVNFLPPLRPDLSVTLQVAPGELRVGGQVMLSGTVPNNGNADAGPCQLLLTFGSQNATISLPAIAAGVNAGFSQMFSLTEPGAQTASAVVDSGNTVAESNKGNNSASMTVTVLPPPLSDLIITGLTPSKSQYLTTESPQLNLACGNSGLAPSPACQLSVKTSSGTVLATVSVPALTVGQSQSLAVALPMLTAGSWTVVAAIDSGNAVVESDETNNGAATSFTVSEPIVPKLPDLTAGAVTFQSYRWFFGLVNFSVPVKNIGQAAGGPFRISVTIPEMNKTLTKNVSGLSLGASTSFGFSLWSVPKTVTLKITADSLNQVTESSESNNYLEVKKTF